MAVKTLVLRVRDFEHLLATRQRALAFLHARGIEPAFRENGDKLAVDYGESMSPEEGEATAEALMRHLGIKRK